MYLNFYKFKSKQSSVSLVFEIECTTTGNLPYLYTYMFNYTYNLSQDTTVSNQNNTIHWFKHVYNC